MTKHHLVRRPYELGRFMCRFRARFPLGAQKKLHCGEPTTVWAKIFTGTTKPNPPRTLRALEDKYFHTQHNFCKTPALRRTFSYTSLPDLLHIGISTNTSRIPPELDVFLLSYWNFLSTQHTNQLGFVMGEIWLLQNIGRPHQLDFPHFRWCVYHGRSKTRLATHKHYTTQLLFNTRFCELCYTPKTRSVLNLMSFFFTLLLSI